MSEIGRSILDFFLLALIAEGSEVTPYALLQRLGISPGASIPALKRLERLGLVKKRTVGPRRRQDFVVTEEGRSHLFKLDKALAKQYETVPVDPESLGRIVALRQSQYGIVLGSLTTAILEKAENKAKQKAAEAASKRLALAAKGLKGNVEEVYQWVLATVESARWQAQETALKDLNAHFAASHDNKKRRAQKARKPA